MIRIQITSPFRYQFRTSDYDNETKADKMIKDHFLTAGSYYTLDPKKDRAEVKFILSPNFIFKNYIYVDVESIPKDISEELKLESGFYEEFTLPKGQEYIPTLIQENKFNEVSESYQPTYIETQVDEGIEGFADPKHNPHDLTTSPNKKPIPLDNIEIVEESDNKEKYKGALNSPDLEPLKKEIDNSIELETEDLQRAERKKELESLHYTKVKEICEVYNIEYVNKKEAIEEILDLEFGNTEAEFSKNITLDNTEKGSPTNIKQ